MKVICISGKARCVDADTEFFDGVRWKKISKYVDGDKVLQYNSDGTATLVHPVEYIKDNCNCLWEFENTRISQCLTDNHNCYYITSKGNLHSKELKEIIKDHENAVNGFSGRFITTFKYGGRGIGLSDYEIKLMCAVICDSSFVTDTDRCYLNLKKEKNKDELRKILSNLSIEWQEKEYVCMPGYTRFIFTAPRRDKEFSEFWYDCSQEQLQIICDNICKWDGYIKNEESMQFSTTSLKTAEFLQFAYASCGYRASIREDVRKHRSKCYDLSISKNVLVSIFDKKTNHSTKLFKKYIPKDGKCYCFTVNSGMLVLRRNRKIFITGNSGKDTSANYLKKKLELSSKRVLIIHYADLLKYICKNIFNWNGVKDDEGRKLLQYVGTDVIREQNPDYWVDFVVSILSMFYGKWDYVLIPDCRFPNEVEQLRKYGLDTCSLRIVRDDFKTSLTTEQQQHASETAMDNFDFDYVIHNKKIEDFYKDLNDFLEQI